MMQSDLDWAAPIVPGKAMMGLHLGMGQDEVWSLLEQNKVSGKDINEQFQVEFTNSPLLLVEVVNGGFLLRDVNSRNPNTSEFDEVFAIGFEDRLLTHLVASLTYGAKLCSYKGKVWGDIGLGSPVVSILKHCQIEFDSGDELFYPVGKNYSGFSIGGTSSPLEDDPDQVVTYIRIYFVEDRVS
ncbi:hypothetical protein [Parachitinimonas caeni]|uniref:Uncharacterized protein n=1 Tax=Parachitinimonas caeni TaxID=3031301 RepID=A0ABT7E3J1_9NEIS|nr:hypothetical protein [Parachitinimonas caeni]MDK2126887.1 hypothetical protein [Parachitinimonas caeni]